MAVVKADAHGAVKSAGSFGGGADWLEARWMKVYCREAGEPILVLATCPNSHMDVVRGRLSQVAHTRAWPGLADAAAAGTRARSILKSIPMGRTGLPDRRGKDILICRQQAPGRKEYLPILPLPILPIRATPGNSFLGLPPWLKNCAGTGWKFS